MQCSSSEHEIPIPIPKRWKINKATIKFQYQNSAALLKRTSQLEILLNDVPLAQIRLDPQASKGNIKLDLPPLLLNAEFNGLKFRVVQHYGTQCENPCAPELWTRIELDDAIVELDYDYRPVPLRISAVSDYLFDTKIFPSAKLNIVTSDLSDANLTTSSIVATGVALRYDFRKTVFTSSEQLKKDQDNVLIGTHEYIAEFLQQYGVRYEGDGPYLRIMHLPNRKTIRTFDLNGKPLITERTVFDKRFALLIIGGKDENELLVAAETLDVLSIPFPDSPDMQVKGFSMPEIAQYSGKKMITTDRTYRLNSLNFFTRTFRGMNSAQSKLVFRVPADFRVKPNQYVNLNLDFSYGAAIRSDSTLNILLNGKHVSAIHLDNENGGLFSDYELKLPTHLFKGGENEIAFEAVLTPSVTEHCGFIQSKNLFLTLFDSSTLLFPSMPHRVELPNLELMFVNGFPYTRWPDGYESLIYLADANRTNLEVALNWVGMITQRNGYPLFGLKVGRYIPDQYDGEIIGIGRFDELEKSFLALAPLKVGDTHTVPYPTFESWDERKSLAFSMQNSEMGQHQGYITQFQSPFKIGRTMTLFAAQSNEGLQRLSHALWESVVQTSAKGDLMLIDYGFNATQFERFGEGREYVVTSLSAGPTFVTGKGGDVNAIEFYLSLYPWLYWVVLSVSILLMVVVIYRLLHRHQVKRLKQTGDEESK